MLAGAIKGEASTLYVRQALINKKEKTITTLM
jgi:hypothetical protein